MCANLFERNGIVKKNEINQTFKKYIGNCQIR